MCERKIQGCGEFVIGGQCTRGREALVWLVVLIRKVMLTRSGILLISYELAYKDLLVGLKIKTKGL